VAGASQRSDTGARLAGCDVLATALDPVVAVTGNADHLGDSVAVPAEDRWVVLYDADCGLCKWLLAGLLRRDRAVRLRPIALQRPEADDLLSDLAPAERMASWHLISPAGVRRSGGAAVASLLRLLPRGRVPAVAFARFPRLSERGYRWVAEHRSQLSRWVPMSFKQRASERVRQREQVVEVHAERTRDDG
jgi:predicted DCC family thiol-disulfide oxidoreductase YuxK